MALQDPLKPKDNGKIGMPRVDPGNNKLPPLTKKSPNDDQKPLGQDKDSDDEKILLRMRKRMERCIDWESTNRAAAIDDLKFKQGEGQWPADVRAQRNIDRRPCLTINKMPVFVRQVTNEQRQNRPAINISPVGDKGDKEVSDILGGMIRAIERDSSADIAYDTAFDNAVSNGFGYFRMLTEYKNPKSFEQCIIIRRIRNPFTVYMDPDHQEPDGADSKYAFITELMPKDEFEEQYPDAAPVPWTMAAQGDNMKFWITKDGLRIAEYYEIEYERRKLVLLSNGHIGYEDDLADTVKTAIDAGKLKIEAERESEEPKVMWYKATALEILDRKEIPGSWIPVFPVIGDEIDVEGKVTLSGIIRNAKDAQRMYNYQSTTEVEVNALQPKAPWIVEEGQIEGHEREWKQANTKNFPYLAYKATDLNGTLAPPPQRQSFSGAPEGIIMAKQAAAQDMMATTGIRFDATLQERMYDESGKAIKELRRSSDIGSFHYIDNLGRSLKHVGRVMIQWIPLVYDTKQVITILRVGGKEEKVTLDPNMPKAYDEKQENTGKMRMFNPNMGEYAVTVTIGPSYATKRIEAAESMMNFAKALPNAAALIADLIAKYQDWEGSEEMATRLAKAIPPQMLTPDEKDIPPQLQAVMQHMDQQIKQLTQQLQQAMAALNDKNADRQVDMAKIEKDFEAKIMAVIANVETKMADVQERAQANLQSHIMQIVDATNQAKGKLEDEA